MGVGLIIGLPLTIGLGEIWGLVVFGLLWLVLGYVLWSQREAAVRQSAHVS